MTNEELIDKIKAEIERRLKKYATDVTMQLEALGKVILELKGILSFLSTFESENPVPKDLEEAADEMAIRAFPEKKSYSTVIDRVVDYNAVDRKNYRDGIIAGAKWQKEQMMKEAVEGEVHPDDCEIWVNLVGYGYKFNDGDKVRVLVLKKED